MSKFQWDPTQDQTYTTADGSQMVLTPTLSRNAGASFTMNAMEQTLSLELHHPTKPGPQWYQWGDEGNWLTKTNINVTAGTFRVTGNGANSALATDGETTVNVFTSGTGCLAFTNLEILNFGAELGNDESFSSVNTTGESSILVNDCGVVNIESNVYISEFSRVEIKSPNLNITNYSNQNFIISSQPNGLGEYSFLYEMDLTYPTFPNDTFLGSIIFKSNSKSKLQAKTIRIGSHLLEDNASVIINTDNYSCMNTTNLSKGSPELTIGPLYNDFVFDLSPESIGYPEGMFNFIKNDGKNTGSLTISTNNNNRFGLEYMLQQKMIYINAAPAFSSAEFDVDFTTKTGYMIIKLRNI